MGNGKSNKRKEIKEMKEQTKLSGILKSNVKFYHKSDVIKPCGYK
jgi:hypothetical protein